MPAPQLKDYENDGGLVVNWEVFGSGGLEVRGMGAMGAVPAPQHVAARGLQLHPPLGLEAWQATPPLLREQGLFTSCPACLLRRVGEVGGRSCAVCVS